MSESADRGRRFRERTAGARLRAPRGCAPRSGKPVLRARAAALLLLTSFLAAAVDAQRLWSVGEVSRAAGGPEVVMEGARVGPGVPGMPGVAQPAMSAEIEVTFDYLRLGMGYLELPLPDGSTIEAENAVFEDRGGGNLMWTGEVPGAGYESVLFTVQDGHLVGWFGEPGGPKYMVHAGPDGRGSLAEEVGPAGDWCGVHEFSQIPGASTRAMMGGNSVASSMGRLLPTSPGRHARPSTEAVLPEEGPHLRSDSPTTFRRWPYLAATEQTALDFVVVYTSGFARATESAGGVSVVLQSGFDYLNLVFRNGRLPAEARLIAASPASSALEKVAASRGALLSALWRDPDAQRLKQRHAADFVHAFATEYGVGGRANLFTGTLHASGGAGVSSSPFNIFAHEVGHNLGGLHEPEDYSDFADTRRTTVEPFAFAHVGSNSEGEAVCTTLATGYHNCTYEPYYSSVRHSPQGWVIGVAGERENERVFHDTVHVLGTRDSLVRASPLGPSKLEAEVTGERSVRLVWEDNAENEEGFYLRVWGEGDSRFPTIGENVTSHALDNLSAPSYRVQLNAFNSAHESWWAAEAEIHGFPLTVGVPIPPYDLDYDSWGVYWGRGVLLRWGQSSPDEKGFRVRQLHGGSGVGGRLPVVAEVEADETSAVIGQQYFRPGRHTSRYVVEAFNAMGSARSESHDVTWTARFPVRGEIVGDDRIRLHWGSGLGDVERFYVAWAWWADDGEWKEHEMFVPGGATGATVRLPELREGLRRRPVRGVQLYVGINPWGCREDLGCRAYWGNPGRIVEPLDGGRFSCHDGFATRWERIVPLGGTWSISMCFEDPAGWQSNAWDYHLESSQSGLMYFFDRDNVEALVKVLNGCAINGHHWVFVAPVTDLKFQLRVKDWYGDREETWLHENRVAGRTARTRSDTTAFPCTAEEIAAAKAASAGEGNGAGLASFGVEPPLAAAAGFGRSLTSLTAGARTDCVPGAPTLTLRGGYTVGMCYETYDGLVGDARDWGLDSSQSGLMYFFDRNNAEVLIKVLDGCGVNGHRWVFVAPVTDLAFNLVVTSPSGERWTHHNRLGRTADAASDVSAFPCST